MLPRIQPIHLEYGTPWSFSSRSFLFSWLSFQAHITLACNTMTCTSHKSKWAGTMRISGHLRLETPIYFLWDFGLWIPPLIVPGNLLVYVTLQNITECAYFCSLQESPRTYCLSICTHSLLLACSTKSKPFALEISKNLRTISPLLSTFWYFYPGKGWRNKKKFPNSSESMNIPIFPNLTLPTEQGICGLCLSFMVSLEIYLL